MRSARWSQMTVAWPLIWPHCYQPGMTHISGKTLFFYKPVMSLFMAKVSLPSFHFTRSMAVLSQSFKQESSSSCPILLGLPRCHFQVLTSPTAWLFLPKARTASGRCAQPSSISIWQLEYGRKLPNCGKTNCGICF